MNSPEPSLDQTETKKAIDELQLFMNRYPNTAKMDTCNSLVKTLRDKLEVKALDGAKLYFQMEQYKAAKVALKNVLVDYPDTKYKDDVLLYMVKSNYNLAVNSIDSKKEERFKETIKSYHTFADAFQGSSKLKEAESMYNTAVKELEKITSNK